MGISTFSYADAPKIEIRGFGTAGSIKSDHKSYYVEEYQTNRSKLTFSPNSRIDLNLFSKLSNDWNVTV
jgi:hypothetical protein